MNSTNAEQTSLIRTNDVKNLIYSIRNQQVMLDSDLATLYQIDTGRLNQAVKRNSSRFPKNFRFQLTEEEYQILRSQFATSKLDNENEILISQIVISKSDNGRGSRGGRRNLPYVFTEQGIAMLSAVLKSDTAINVSIRIMESFVEMRRYMASTSLVHQRLDIVEKRQQETESRLEQVFDYIAIHEESEQKVFFEGQIYDAFNLIANLIRKADSTLILIDNYVDIDTLNLLAKKKKNVETTIYTLKNTTLSKTDIANFNKQYPKLIVQYTGTFHDRFLIVDNKYAYHIGASIKDAGKKCFAINLIKEMELLRGILHQIS